MAQSKVHRKLAAILSADVVGYSKLMADDEAATVDTIKQYRAAVERVINRHDGRIVNAPGDNMLAEFPSAVESVQAAVEIQRNIEGRNAELPEDRQMHFRVGLNLGDVIEEDDGTIYGDGVNIAARMEALAEEGGICISSTIHDAVEGKLDFDFEFLGERSVKNIAKPVRVYRVRGDLVEKAKKPTVGRTKKLAMVAAAGVLVIATAAVLLAPPWAERRSTSISPIAAEPPLPDKPSIAVLAFQNMGGDPGQDYFGDSVAEAVITGLTRSPYLFVIARNSSFAYKGKSVDVREIGRELGVRYVLEGSFVRLPGRARVTAQLIDATTGHHVWAEDFDVKSDDIFELIDDLTLNIAHEVDIELYTGDKSLAGSPGTKSIKAWELVLKAAEIVDNSQLEKLDLAERYCREALELDPEYAAAVVMLGWIAFNRGFFHWGEDPEAEYAKAMEYAEAALSIDETSPSAHILLTDIHRHHTLEFGKALFHANRAFSLASNDASAVLNLGNTLTWLGDPQRGLELTLRAYRMAPNLVWPLALVGNAYFVLERYEEAIAYFEECIKRAPGNPTCRRVLLMSYVELGQIEKARQQADELMKAMPEFKVDEYGTFTNDAALRERMRAALRKAGVK